MSPGGSISPFGIKTSRTAEHKVTETGSKNFASGNSGNIRGNSEGRHSWLRAACHPAGSEDRSWSQ